MNDSLRTANRDSVAADAAPLTSTGARRGLLARRPVRALAALAVPVVFLAACSGSEGSKEAAPDDKAAGASAGPSAEPKPEPVAHKTLPKPCDTLSEKTVKAVVPGAKSGKALNSEDQDSYGTCLWTGLDEYDYRALSVALRRFDSDVTLGSGAKRAAEHAGKQRDAIAANDENKNVEESELAGVGDSATGIAYETKKKDGKKSEDYREHRVVVVSDNVVITVDYSGAGFEDAKTPSADKVRGGAEKAAKEALAALK
ncbi:DUF3558 domain-containing protein [Streptomyces alkaliterrae]|uniref:DUF3558 domain-containing protein n=1 Tax=Streptomyces alkaliterrae TaxID=2213162 RepID=A0A5P0YTR6_9ACTN|nr:DUF3558 domain-containing protein [Streptomyces alkaliterrae]MBB1257426.1 DUF3558 domain-containing protein [Streptomyces alkaliterrae]MQS02832.1 DUF3558 domain-containing protein [Streptomyces alkaliterrae]